MTNRQNHRCCAVKAVQRHIATFTKINDAFAVLRLHVLCRAAQAGLLLQQLHGLTYRFDGAFGRINVFFCQKSVQALNITRRGELVGLAQW
jgi:hypothetical protein